MHLNSLILISFFHQSHLFHNTISSIHLHLLRHLKYDSCTSFLSNCSNVLVSPPFPSSMQLTCAISPFCISLQDEYTKHLEEFGAKLIESLNLSFNRIDKELLPVKVERYSQDRYSSRNLISFLSFSLHQSQFSPIFSMLFASLCMTP